MRVFYMKNVELYERSITMTFCGHVNNKNNAETTHENHKDCVPQILSREKNLSEKKFNSVARNEVHKKCLLICTQFYYND